MKALLVLAGLSLAAVVVADGQSTFGDPVANPAAVLETADGLCRFTVLTSAMVRVECGPGGVGFEDRQTMVVWNRNLPVPSFQTLNGTGGAVKIATPDVTLAYAGGGIGGVTVTSHRPNINNQTTVWRHGASTAGNLFGTAHTLDNLEGWQSLNCTTHHPWIIHDEPEHCTWGLISKTGVAWFDDAESPVFENGWVASQLRGSCAAAGDTPCFGAVKNNPNTSDACTHAGCCWTPASQCARRGGVTDTYVLAHGAEFKEAFADFARVAGPIPIPRRHFLGVSWSFWGSVDQNGTMGQVNGLVGNDFSLDSYTFDMQWHLKPDWTGYTWDTNLFPDHVALLDWMHALGLYTGFNLHDASGVRGFEKRYAAMAVANGIDPASNATVEFHIDNQTFADSLSEVVLGPLVEEGIDFHWIDWQQGMLGIQDVAGSNPTMLLAHYRFTNYSNSDRRGLVHCRYGGLGSHRYPTGFGGDVVQTWDSLAYMLYFTSTASNVLYGYWGQELMQSAGNDSDPAALELFTRVSQFGAWSPVTTFWGNAREDDNLWEMPEPYLSAVRDALADRNTLLPYRYTLSKVAFDTAVSPVRPMYHEHPFSPEAYTAPLQYFFGPDLVVAPAHNASTNGTVVVPVWLPPGASWLPFYNACGAAVAGPASISVAAPLDTVPVFVRQGSLIPMLPRAAATSVGAASKPFSLLQFALHADVTDVGFATSTWVYEDDGISNDYLTHAQANTTATVSVVAGAAGASCVHATVGTSGSYVGMPASKSFTFVFPGAAKHDVVSATVDGAAVPQSTAFPPPPSTWSSSGCSTAVSGGEGPAHTPRAFVVCFK